MLRKTLLPLLLLAPVLIACGDDDDPSGPGDIVSSYEVQITGSLTETSRGKAYFGADTGDDGQPVFGLVLGDDTTRHFLVAVKEGASRPAKGSYALVDPESSTAGWNLVHVVSDGDEILGLFYAESGTLTITESTDDVIRGTLTAEATGFMGDELADIDVTASFVAVPAPQLSVSAARRAR